MADAVPGDLAVLLVDLRLHAEVAEQVVQIGRVVRVPLAVEPNLVPAIVFGIVSPLLEPPSECFGSPFLYRHLPVLTVLRRLLPRDVERRLLGADPAGPGPTDLDRSKPGVECRPDERRGLPALVYLLPILG